MIIDMLIYKFKVSFEDQDDFLREIELRADQTFEDFHQAILGNLGLDPGMLASFFICDYRFRKQKEIQLVETTPTRASQKKDPDDGPENISKALLMRESELKDYIDDPHQRLLFIYDYVSNWTFYIELIKIMHEDKSISYPYFSKSLGPVPRELVPVPKNIPEPDLLDDVIYEDEEEMLPEELPGFEEINTEDNLFNDEAGESPDDFPEYEN